MLMQNFARSMKMQTNNVNGKWTELELAQRHLWIGEVGDRTINPVNTG